MASKYDNMASDKDANHHKECPIWYDTRAWNVRIIFTHPGVTKKYQIHLIFLRNKRTFIFINFLPHNTLVF